MALNNKHIYIPSCLHDTPIYEMVILPYTWYHIPYNTNNIHGGSMFYILVVKLTKMVP